MAIPREELTFWPGETDAVTEAMAELAASRRGWINLRPDVPPDHDPGQPGPFSGSGPAVPLCTWWPGEQRRRRTEPPSIGIEHATGSKAAARLAAAGHEVPSAWEVVQDNPRRGLVIRLPDDASHDIVLDWLLEAGRLLARAPITGRWLGAIFRT